MKSKLLYKIGLIIGFVTLSILFLLFISWWIAKAVFVINVPIYLPIILVWTLISISLAFIGLIFQIIVTVRNFKKYLLKPICGIILILIYFPIIYGVIIWSSEIESRAYFKIYNNTNQSNIELTFKDSKGERKLGTLNKNGSLIDFCYPQYLLPRATSSYHFDLIIKSESGIRIIEMPYIRKDECKSYYINQDFKLQNI